MEESLPKLQCDYVTDDYSLLVAVTLRRSHSLPALRTLVYDDDGYEDSKMAADVEDEWSSDEEELYRERIEQKPAEDSPESATADGDKSTTNNTVSAGILV